MYERKSKTKFAVQNAVVFIPDTICWYFDLTYLSCTIKPIIDENLNEKAMEIIIDTMKPLNALLFCDCANVKGKGLLDTVTDRSDPKIWLMTVSAANVSK